MATKRPKPRVKKSSSVDEANRLFVNKIIKKLQGMKFFIFLALFAVSMTAGAQNYAVVNIWAVNPSTATVGDSVDILYKFSPPNIAPYNPNAAIDLSDGATTLRNLWSGPWQALGSFPKVEFSPGDSVYRMRVKIPVASAPGAAGVYGSGGAVRYDITLLPRVTTAVIQSTRADKPVSVEYYTLGGSQLDTAPFNAVILTVEYYADGTFIAKQTKRVE